MTSLTDLIRVLTPDGAEEPEDIFSSAPGFLFTDDLRNIHGDDRTTLIYQSTRFGDIELKAADPQTEDERRLFGHYLWNAGIKLAELISYDEAWSVKDRRVLELGAGVGLSGIVATLAGAEVVISDYPTNVLLQNIALNATKAIPAEQQHRYSVQGYEWGDLTGAFAVLNAHAFTRVIAADCYWMPGEHPNLVTSMLHFLALSEDARIYTVAGFHTGRAKLAGFFEEAVSQGLEVEQIYEEDAYGAKKDWAAERDGGTENVTERKKWLVIAILKRPSG